MLHRCILGLAVLFAAWCLPVAEAVAFDPPLVFEPVTDADWAIVQDTAKGIQDAVMVFERVVIDDSGLRRITYKQLTSARCYRVLYRRVRILGASGRKWADVDVPRLHEEQKIESILGRTVQRDGTITLLQPDQIHEKEVVKTDDEKVKQTSFSIPGATDDCIVEYIITLKMPFRGTYWVIQKEIPLRAFTFDWKLANADMDQAVYDIIRADPTMDFTVPNYLWLNPNGAQKITTLPSKEKPEILRFETDNVPAFEQEPSPMPDNSVKESLICYSGTDVGTAAFWGAYSVSEAKELTSFCEKEKKVKEIAAQFSALPDTTARIEAAYDWVQKNILNLTYLDLRDKNDSTKIREAESRRSIEDVLKLGYGTRRDIDKLFWKLLRVMGVEAKYLHVDDRSDDLFVEKAKYWQFDRSLVAVPIGKSDFRFYAPGHVCTPSGLVPWFLEGVTGLMLDADEYFVTVPFSEAGATSVNSHASYTLTDELVVKGAVRAEFTGQEARTLRMAIFDEAPSTHFDNLKEEIDQAFPGAEFETIEYENFDSLYQPFVLKMGVKYPPVEQVGDKILIKPCDYISESKNDFVKAQRLGPVLFRNASTFMETAEFTLPEGWQVDALPGDTTYQNKVGACAAGFARSDAGFTVTRTFSLAGPYWLVSDYAAVRRLLQACEDMSARIVVLKSAGAAGSFD